MADSGDVVGKVQSKPCGARMQALEDRWGQVKMIHGQALKRLLLDSLGQLCPLNMNPWVRTETKEQRK